MLTLMGRPIFDISQALSLLLLLFHSFVFVKVFSMDSLKPFIFLFLVLLIPLFPAQWSNDACFMCICLLFLIVILYYLVAIFKLPNPINESLLEMFLNTPFLILNFLYQDDQRPLFKVGN